MGQTYTTMAGAAGARHHPGGGGAPPVIVLVGPQGSGKTTLHRRLAFDPDRPGAFTGPLRTTKIPTWGDAAIPVASHATPPSTTNPAPRALVAVAPEPIAAVDPPAATTTVPARMLDLGGSPAARAEWPAALAHTPPDAVLFVVDAATLTDASAVAASVSLFKDVLYHRDVIKDGGGGPAAAPAGPPVKDAVVVVVFNRRGDAVAPPPPAVGPSQAAAAAVADDEPEPVSPPSTTETHRPPAVAGFSAAVTDDSLEGSASFGERPMSPADNGPVAVCAAADATDAEPAATAYLEAWGDLRGMLAAAVTERRGPQAVLCPGSVCAMRHAVVDADLQTGDGVPQLLLTVTRLLSI